jgi:hypothetical protein
MLWNTAGDEQLGEHGQDVVRGEAAGDPDRQALPAELVDDHEHPEHLAVAGAVLDEVVGPDLVRALRPEPHARAVAQPQARTLGLLLRDLQPLAPPDPLDPLRVHPPARPPQQGGDPAVAVPPVRARQRDDPGGEPLLLGPGLGRVALHGERCWPSTRQARRSETPSRPRAAATPARRRSGLRSFPRPPPRGSACRGSGPPPPGAGARSPAPAPWAGAPG